MYVDKSRTYIGIVEVNQDPKKLGRCRIRVVDIFDDIPTNDIPWASSWKDLNGNAFNVPEVGKIVTVVFDSGNIYKPEYIYAEHYNINLEKKLSDISDSDYPTMKSLIFDHKTQIYVNDSEGLKIDYKFNNLNIQEKTINLNLKDNYASLNLGDETSNQQAILGNHWMDWFDTFVQNLMGANGGPFLGNLGAPVIPNPDFITCLQDYQTKRDPTFLSHHVNIVDNNQVKTVQNTSRENNPQSGDAWTSTTQTNNLVTSISDNFEPQQGIIDPTQMDDPSYVPPPTDGSPDTTPVTATWSNPPLTDQTSNPKIDKLIRFLTSKNYVIYNNKYELNLVGLRNAIKDDGTVTNQFDDTLCIFYRDENNNWNLTEMSITTTPGYEPGQKQLPKKVAIMSLAQYVDQYQLGYHQGKKDHPCLKYATTKQNRNDNLSDYDYLSPIETKSIGLNIHHSGNPKGNFVFNWSAGCQVLKLYSDWQQMISLCNKQVNTTSRSTFTYALCKQSEFDAFS